MVRATKRIQVGTNTKLIMHMAHMIITIIITMNRTLTVDRQLSLIN